MLLWVLCAPVSIAAKAAIETLEVSAQPVDTAAPYKGAYIAFPNGRSIPTLPEEGVYRLRFQVSGLDSIANPALYIGAVSYPVRFYLDGQEFFRWSHTLSQFKMQCSVPQFAPLYGAGDRDSIEITAHFYNDGQTIAFPTLWVEEREVVEDYTTLQVFLAADGLAITATLSFLLGIILLFYYYLSRKEHIIILFSGLFALCSGASYSVWIFDMPFVEQIFWIKLARVTLPFSCCLLYSSNIRLIHNRNKTVSNLEKLFYLFSIISAVAMISAPGINHVIERFKFSGVTIIYPVFIIISTLLFRSVFLRKEKRATFIFWGVMAIILTSSIDLYFLLFNIQPYMWASGYGQFIHILTIVLTIGLYEQEVHDQIVHVKNDLVDLNHKLEQSNAQVKRESFLKERFIKAVSHELRTPLNAVVGIVSELSDRSIPFHRELSLSVTRLRLSISNLFEYQAIGVESAVVYTAIDPQRICANIISLHRETAASKGVALSLNEDEHAPVPPRVLGCGEALQSIVNNTLSNALKFTKEGAVTMDTAYREGTLSIVVSDTGEGLSETDLESLFQQFEQANQSLYTREQNQIGIGLQIIQTHVRRLKGTIAINTRPTGGVAVTITLPFAMATEATTQSSAAPKRVLVVDDNDINRLIVGKVLTRENIPFDTAENGLMALDMMEEISYSLVLMDIQMPLMNGLQATEALRERAISTPVVALTANADADECYAAGMNAVVRKPFDVKELIDVVYRHGQA